MLSLLVDIVYFSLNVNSLQKAKMGSQHWSSAQESLLSLEKSSVASVGEIVR